MNERTFRAMNTEWWIGTPATLDLAPLEEEVHAAEARYSRFLPSSALSRLNRDRVLHDRDLARVVGGALGLHEATAGAFDVRVGAAMNAAGYDRTFDLLSTQARDVPGHGGAVLAFAPPATALNVTVRGDRVSLEGEGTIDLGGIAKGWTVDRVADRLAAAGCADYVIDGGGDIRAAGHDPMGDPWIIGVADDRAVRLRDAAVCTSSTRRRRWRAAGEDAHHIIDPATGAPARHGVVEAVVIARDATTADVLATTIIADPDRGLAALAAHGAEAMVLRDGHWEMTKGMRSWLI